MMNSSCNAILSCDSDAEVIRKQEAQLEEVYGTLFEKTLQLKASNTCYRYMRRQMYQLTLGWWPFVSKKRLLALLNEHNLK
ncbi:MAG: hypothetical protein RLZZ480_21 [Candidatus Parcubacteria bacterium]|jgi:hypothetical protein